MLLMALSTGHKLGLALAVVGFAGFSLIVSMLVPRSWPQFPARGLQVFLVVIVLLFIGMMAAVIVFGRESGEAAAAGKKVQVTEVDYKIRMPETFSAGTYTFVVQNKGKVPHNLTIRGPGVSAATPNFGPGSTQQVSADLKPGKYDFYCSVPGHKQLGMNVNVTVS